MKLTDKRIIDFISKKAETNGFDLDKFLNPSADQLRDANLLFNMKEAAQKIQNAINEKKKILVYGDYDADGICSSTILYLFFKSLGANVDVFIPNRFDNGYGISVEAIEEIEFEFNPDLIVTVDLGITAVEEVEILKQEGIDIVITDHHIPLSEVPDCLIVDPKYNSKDYGFDALCGAGVALKLVEAMSNRETALDYVDICSIATVGDIVPLVDENRVIAKLGIEKINSGNCLKSLTFLKNKLEIDILTSTDISFKIVPRLNACGRMDSAIKVFEFLVENDEKQLERKYTEIESDNTLRLASIDKGNKIIDNCLKNSNLNEPSLLVVGDFHEGIVGILASRLCHEFNKPAIIFTKTEEGTLKGSGRSIASVDIHKIISTMTDMLENFGGHKMAVGLELQPEVFDQFKTEFNKKIDEVSTEDDFLIDNLMFDIEITDDDLSLDFVKQLSMLEPFGCENEKPVLALKTNQMNVVPVSEKAFKHYKCFTLKNNSLMGFSFYNKASVVASKSTKQFIVELGTNTFKGKTSLNAIIKNLNVLSANLEGFEEQSFMTSLYNKYYSIFDFNNQENYVLTKNVESEISKLFAESKYGTLVVASTQDDICVVEKLGLQKYYSAEPFKNGQNTVLVNPKGVVDINEIVGYKNIIFLHKVFNNEHLFLSQKFRVVEPEQKTKIDIQISKDREVLAMVYKLAIAFSTLKANDVLDLASKLALKSGNLSASQILFGLIVFMELNFLEWDDILNSLQVLKSKKVELSSSKFLNEVTADV